MEQQTQDWGRHEFVYRVFGHNGDWRKAKSSWQGRRLNQPLYAFETKSHKGTLGKNFSLIKPDTEQIMVMALKKAENSDSYIIRLCELSGRPVKNSVLAIGNAIVAAYEVNGQEKEIGSAVIRNGKLVVNMDANEIRSFAFKLKRPEFESTLPKTRAVKLAYDTDVISSDTNRLDGDMDKSGKTIPSELFPRKLTKDAIKFELGSDADGQMNAMICNGQQIQLPEGNYNRIYLLAAADDDTSDTFIAGSSRKTLNIQKWTGFIGQYDKRIWPKPFEEIDYAGQRKISGIEPGYIKRDNIAWFGTHRHSPAGNDAYQYCYIYKYCLEIDGAKTLILPQNQKIKVFAVTVSKNDIDDITPVMSLYDDFAKRRLETNLN